MEPANSIYSSVLLLGAAQGLFLSLALVNAKGGNALAHRFLALLTLAFAADLGVDFLYQSRYLLLFPKLAFFAEAVSFLYGPLAYFYVTALTAKDGFRFSGKNWWHFLPFALGVLLLIPLYMLSDSEVVALIYEDADVDSIGLWIIGVLLVLVLPIPQIGIYLFLSARLLVRHSREIRDQFSSIERINLNWLRNLLISLAVLYLIYMFAVLFSEQLGIGEKTESVLNLLIVIVIYTMGYLGLQQPDIFAQAGDEAVPATDAPDRVDNDSVEPANRKYQKSALDADMSRALLAELQAYMASEEPYLDNKLTLTQLAAQMRISPNYLSQVINEQTGSNFFDYINKHRVAVAKQLLASAGNSKPSILSIAMDAGFNSKSAFYTAFKQHANMTPGEFRKTLKPPA
jgi:AraC-like DNA-binding protein